MTTTSQAAGQSLIPSQSSEGLDEAVVSVNLSFHKKTTILSSSTADRGVARNFLERFSKPSKDFWAVEQ